ncbi:MAG TPA: Cache 3/Cache 2 fusion domain-containing protein, partial [Fimbriimonadaceae bacterium]|nr:Cache 3/Cache 2 fusion domain-containing protein [Fimbriimonadaceae bacterium]
MTLQRKLAVIGAGISFVIVALLVVVGWSAGGKFGAIAQHEVEGLVESDQGHTALALNGLIKAQDDLLSRELETDSAVLWHAIRQRGAITQSGAETWKAANQFTKEAKTVTLARVMIGGEWLQHNSGFDQRTPIIDDVTDLTGGTVTYFQRMNEEGDMLRVATSVKKKDGKRAIETYIPATNPDGKPNPVVKTVLAKQTYRGS